MPKLSPSNHLLEIRDSGVIKRLVKDVEIDKKTGCWIWTKYKDRKGYGQIWYHGRMHWVHRISYAVFNGEIKAGLTVNHTCFNPNCCNPEHLTLLTLSENRRRKNGDE